MSSKCKICKKYRQISSHNKWSLNANTTHTLSLQIWHTKVFEFQMYIIENSNLEPYTFRANENAEICTFKDNTFK